jgi:hypothetical protein
MQDYLNELDERLIYDKCEKTEGAIDIYAHMLRNETRKRHSAKLRIVRDLPFGSRKATLYITVNRYFIDYDRRTTEMERLPFAGASRRRTKRLDDFILKTQAETTAIGCERMIRSGCADVSDTTILRIVKKNSSSENSPASPPSA